MSQRTQAGKLFLWLTLLLPITTGCSELAPSPPTATHSAVESGAVTAESGALTIEPGPPAGRAERIIVAFGNSLTAGLGVAPQEAYPALLQARLRQEGYPYRVINAGISGDTTAGGLRRVDWVLKAGPEIVILELGANDGLRGMALGQARDNLSQIITRLQKSQVRVILAGMKIPPNYGPRYTTAFSALYPDLSKRHKVRLIPFFLEGVAGRTDLNQADGLHPTAEGYRKILDGLWPVLRPLLQRDPRPL